MIVGVSWGVVDAAVVADAEDADDGQEDGEDYDEDGKVLLKMDRT